MGLVMQKSSRCGRRTCGTNQLARSSTKSPTAVRTEHSMHPSAKLLKTCFLPSSLDHRQRD